MKMSQHIMLFFFSLQICYLADKGLCDDFRIYRQGPEESKLLISDKVSTSPQELIQDIFVSDSPELNRDPEKYSRADLTGLNLAALNRDTANKEKGQIQPKLTLLRADFSNSFLQTSRLSNCNLRRCNFSGAYLTDSWLQSAELQGCVFTGAHANFCDFTNAYLESCKADRLSAKRANFHGATLRGSRLDDADCLAADFEGANLTRVVLSGADLRNANLANAILTETVLERCKLADADLTNAIFQPALLPEAAELSRVTGLKQLRTEAGSKPNLQPLMNAQKLLLEAGFDKQSREVACSIERNREVHWIAKQLRLVFLDLACEYGCSSYRPLMIIVINAGLFSVVYFVLLQRDTSGKGVVFVHFSDVENPHEKKCERLLDCNLVWYANHSYERLCAAMHLSLTNACRLGFKDFNLGSWLSFLQGHPYSIETKGAIRVIAGVQSLLSAYCLVLWVLCTFGRPFGG